MSAGNNEIRTALQKDSIAVRLSFTWMGWRRSLTAAQTAQAAEAFGANGRSLSAGKKLIDTKNEHWQKVAGIKTRVRDFWKAVTLPFPEDGIRLMKRSYLDSFGTRMAEFKQELKDAVAELDENYTTLKVLAREQLGQLYREGDYPATLEGQFDVGWEFPSVEPPNYLKELSPELYEKEQQRIAARFEEAIQMAENAFTDEFAKLIGNLTERLTDTEAGEKKVMKSSTLGNLKEFFQKFKDVSVRSNGALDALVDKAAKLVDGVDVKELRSNDELRAEIKTAMNEINAAIQTEVKPSRRILMEDEAEQTQEAGI